VLWHELVRVLGNIVGDVGYTDAKLDSIRADVLKALDLDAGLHMRYAVMTAKKPRKRRLCHEKAMSVWDWACVPCIHSKLSTCEVNVSIELSQPGPSLGRPEQEIGSSDAKRSTAGR
jgi:hypothetical protein